MLCLAKLLAVAAQELVGLDESATVLRDLSGGRVLRRTVRLRIVLFFPAETQTQQHAQAVGIEGEHGKSAREQEDLFGAGVPDRDFFKALIASLGGRRRTPERSPPNSSSAVAAISRTFLTVLPGMIPFRPVSWSAAREPRGFSRA